MVRIAGTLPENGQTVYLADLQGIEDRWVGPLEGDELRLSRVEATRIWLFLRVHQHIYSPYLVETP